MSRYAEWIEYEQGGRNGRILKRAIKQRRRIFDENENCYLVEDQEGPVWVPKNSVRVVEKEEYESL